MALVSGVFGIARCTEIYQEALAKHLKSTNHCDSSASTPVRSTILQVVKAPSRLANVAHFECSLIEFKFQLISLQLAL